MNDEERTLPSTPPTINWLREVDARLERMEKVMANVDTRSAETYETVRHLRLHFFYVPSLIAAAAVVLAMLSYSTSQAADERIDGHIHHHRDAGK